MRELWADAEYRAKQIASRKHGWERDKSCLKCGKIFTAATRSTKFCSLECSLVFRNSNGINDGVVKWCSACKLTRPVSEFFKNKARTDGLSVLCWECHCAIGARLRQKSREKVFDKLGRSCKRCGFSADIRALQIDHVNGCGIESRVSFHALYAQVLADTEGKFQVLCANCNVIKKIENREWKLSTKPRRAESAA